MNKNKKKSFNIKSCIALLLLLSFGCAKVQAADWMEKEYGHFSAGEPLRSVILSFGSSIGLPVVLSSHVNDTFTGSIENTTSLSFIETLSARYSLSWYFDGYNLYVSKADEVATILIKLEHITPGDVQNELRNLGVWDVRFPWRRTGTGNLLYISGPPRYIDIIREVVSSIDLKQAAPDGLNNEYSAKTFRLQYAKAADQTIEHRGGTRTIQGVATILQSLVAEIRNIDSPQVLVGSDTNAIEFGNNEHTQETQGLANESIADLIRSGNSPVRGSKTPRGNRDRLSKNRNRFTPYIRADERNNSLIVFDRTVRLPIYERLIAELDVPSEQIEIEVSIIDVTADRLKEIGVDWQVNQELGGSNINLGFGDLTTPTTGLAASIIDGSGDNFTTVLANGGNFFLSRIRALASEGEATVLSQPSVLTQNNLEAVLDHSTSFFVRLSGEDVADLEQITVGSFLQVTPQILQTSFERSVQLEVRIEDGRLLDETVDDIPQIINTAINTTATIEADASLLIGGYYYDRQTAFEQKVPVLGDIPVLGKFFKQRSQEGIKTARLFLITPNIRPSIDKNNIPERYATLIESLKSDSKKNFYGKSRIPIFE